ncbi:MAG: DEAD/DEAH box helicase [Kiritimatiellae bacterium]|nr:DEAD/DEAH box helicase [Kiritimatiellia bacterium]
MLRRVRDKVRQLSGRKKPGASPTSHHPESPPARLASARAEHSRPKAHRDDRRPARHAPQKTHAQPAAAPKWNLASFQIAPKEGKARFHDLGLPDEVMHAIDDLEFEYCTPIQGAILPKTLAGLDAGGRAQTGTGKTAAFLITIFTHLLRKPLGQRPPGSPRALILAPTRELCMQIHREAEEIGRYAAFKNMAVFGGMDYDKQRQTLKQNVIDVMVATPGRLLDFKGQRCLHLDKVEILVIDEADRMLDMGFIPAVREIVHGTPPKAQRQTMLFSATLTPEVTRLCAQWTRDPVLVEIEPEQVAAESVDQIVYITTTDEKFPVLYNILRRNPDTPVLIFTNRRDQARDLSDKLRAYGIACAQMTGDVPQEKRMKTLENFKTGRVKVLVATDVAGRGLHVEDISHVINYNLPVEPEDYVHRIGRTGRAGARGTSVSFASEYDGLYIPDIEKYLGEPLKCIHPEPELLVPPPAPAHPHIPRPPRSRPARGGARPRRGGSRRR